MEYEAVISRILEAERNAREITRETREREARLEEDLEKETESVRAECFAWAEQKLEKLRQETERHKAEALQTQNDRAAELLSGIERAYRLYGDNWVDTLFHQIVGKGL